MPGDPSESLSTSRRRFLKAAAAVLASAGAGVALSPQTRNAADIVDLATQAAAEKALQIAREKWEGQAAIRLTKIPDDTGLQLWQDLLNSSKLDHTTEPVRLTTLVTLKGYVGIMAPKDAKFPELFIAQVGKRPWSKDPVFVYADPASNTEAEKTTLESVDPRYLMAAFTAAQKTGVFFVDTVLLAQRNEEGKLWAIQLPQNPYNQPTLLLKIESEGKSKYYLVEQTTTGLKDAKDNLGKSVEPIK